ncbi:MAG: DUF1844 domain-containing protein [Vicinamibacterales bacterium]
MPDSSRPDVTFNDFVIWLATMAAVQLGDIDEAETEGEKHQPNLDAAAHLIDMLALVQEKTRGNLAPDEDRLLSQLLYDLRMRFVHARDRSPRRIIVP